MKLIVLGFILCAIGSLGVFIYILHKGLQLGVQLWAILMLGIAFLGLVIMVIGMVKEINAEEGNNETKV